MIWFILITIVFVFLLIFPFAVALSSVKKRKDTSLSIRGDNIRDPRYFSKSFSALVEKGISEEKGTVKLSREEQFILPKDIKGNTCDLLVYAKNNFAPKGISQFTNVIYAKMSAEIEPRTQLRAIACFDTLTLGRSSEVIRWADAVTQLTAQSGCILGMSTTSGKRLIINANCIFRRLYAPEIHIGQDAKKNVYLFNGQRIYDEVVRDPEEIADNEVIMSSVITRNDLVIGKDTTIYGSVKTNKQLIVQRGVVIMGNVVVDGLLILEEGVKIAGNVFSQDTIFVGPDVQIGIKSRIKSIIAKNDIILCETSNIYGYISCERAGKSVTRDEFMQKYSSN